MTTPGSQPAPGDTFQRSCDHWSERGRREMEAFYQLATEDYRQLAGVADWSRLLHTLADRNEADTEGDSDSDRLRLLDVACGSGQFPRALLLHTDVPALSDEGLVVEYDLLDPAPFSIQEAKGKLQPPFQPGAELCVTIQDLQAPAETYDLIWATHAIYCVPPEDLQVGLERLLDVLKADGLAVIGHANEQAHYLQFYRHYLKVFRDGQGTPYLSAEQIRDGLDRLGVEHQVRTLHYEGVVEADRLDVLEGYLQRCAFDDAISLEQLRAAPETSGYLNSCFHPEEQQYRFPIATDVIVFGKPGGSMPFAFPWT